jgi:serine phosphatase RsbU (regulator of sigma subunit)/CheY-like chemotaxis protein
MQDIRKSPDELISFADDREVEQPTFEGTWKVMIVDDEIDVHKVTQLVLSGFSFDGKSIEFIDCYSAGDARDALRRNPDVAIVILDVVMEEMDSGLRLVEFIRDELNNKYVRIILRTGQPGQAPERQVILQYNISDYKSKIELTSEKLLTSVISCLRSYIDMVTIERNRRGLEKIVVAADDIFQIRSSQEFLLEVVVQLKEILIHDTAPSDSLIRAVCAVRSDSAFIVQSSEGEYASPPVGQDLSLVLSSEAYECVIIAARQKISVYEKGVYVIVLHPSGGNEYAICVEKSSPFDEWEKDLLEIFGANLVTAFENLTLNLELEHKVEQRTAELRRAKEAVESTMHELETINERLTVTNEELETAKSIADQDMRMAINVQENVLPNVSPVSDAWEAGYYFRPMSGVSGDFYDFIPDEKGNLSGIALFDVSGHGIASGLITMLAKSITFRRFRAMSDSPLSKVIDSINDDLIAELENVPNFLSGVMLRLGDGSAEYVNAGHPDIILRQADGSCRNWADEADNPKGFYLGIKSMRAPHGVCSVAVERGEFIVAFSDCMVETSNVVSEQYGIQRLLESITALDPALSAQGAADSIMKRFWDFIGDRKLPDDLTLVIVKRL